MIIFATFPAKWKGIFSARWVGLVVVWSIMRRPVTEARIAMGQDRSLILLVFECYLFKHHFVLKQIPIAPYCSKLEEYFKGAVAFPLKHL